LGAAAGAAGCDTPSPCYYEPNDPGCPGHGYYDFAPPGEGGIATDDGGADLAGADLTGADLAMPEQDLTMTEQDMAGQDMAMVLPDQSVIPDQSVLPDQTALPDLSGSD
jgi:hypothetical protein